ncbi:MAG TPA: putative metal-dependent hydrolase [Terriglobia bacterium]|nr:putative metal-dependent hydrolase [Terriglobia bacterium]
MASDLQYPIGKFQWAGSTTEAERREFIAQIEETPARLREAVQGLSEQQLDTPYRHGGWTVRQVVHHLADSHMNAFVRFKLALTEEQPTIKPYNQDLWASTADAKEFPINPSLNLLESVHTRLVALLRSMRATDFARTFNHPESGVNTLDKYLALYAWHGRHHVGHITSLRERMKW